jgi:hypothetical protein
MVYRAQKTNRTGLILAGILGMLLFVIGAYIGSYYAMLGPEWNRLKPPPGWIGPPVRPRRAPWEQPEYRIEHDAVRTFLEPAHQLDRLIRPKRW